MTGIIIIAWTFGPHYIGFPKKIHTHREREGLLLIIFHLEHRDKAKTLC